MSTPFAVVWSIVLVAALVGGIWSGVSSRRTSKSERSQGVYRFQGCVLSGGTLSIGGALHAVTSSTHAEVLGMAQETRRSTATRTAAGAAVGGIPGALVGHAAKKKTSSSNAVLAVNGDDWSESVPVSAAGYREAVEFAQKINLAARRSTR